MKIILSGGGNRGSCDVGGVPKLAQHHRGNRVASVGFHYTLGRPPCGAVPGSASPGLLCINMKPGLVLNVLTEYEVVGCHRGASGNSHVMR